MKKSISTILFMLLFLSGIVAQVPSDPTQDLQSQTESLQVQIKKIEDNTIDRIDKLDSKIDGINYGILQQLAIPLAIGVITFLLGLWATKRQMRIISDEKIKEWLEKIAPDQCEIALQNYLKARFPGNLEFLMSAAKNIAYDQELRQLKTIRIIGMDELLSQTIVAQLRTNDFLQVEFVKHNPDKKLPQADLILIDRYSCLKSDTPMGEEDVKQLITQAKSSPEKPAVHYFGKTIYGLPEIITAKHALSSAQFSLIPNIMDQLRFVFPQSKK